MNCQLQVLTSEESFQFSFITVLQGVNPWGSNDLPACWKNYLFVSHWFII